MTNHYHNHQDVKTSAVPGTGISDYEKISYEPAYTPKAIETKPSGGPSSYYDMPFKDWVTTNDQMEYLAENKWGKYAIHLKDIFKGLCRWGDKKGTDPLYDTKKIIYYGARVLRMMVGVTKTREYLQSLLDDKQFMEKPPNE